MFTGTVKILIVPLGGFLRRKSELKRENSEALIREVTVTKVSSGIAQIDPGKLDARLAELLLHNFIDGETVRMP